MTSRKEPQRPDMNSIPHATACGDDTLLELLDRLLNAGVVLLGDVVISVADVELICLRLQLVLSSAETAREIGMFVPSQDFDPVRQDT